MSSAPERTLVRVEPLDTLAHVETPELVRFHYRVAGPARRAAAYVIDLLVRGVIMIVLAVLVSIAGLGDSDTLAGIGMGVLLAIFFAMEWGYFVLCETLMNGRSIGKRAFNLRVVKESGVPLTFADSLLRNLLRAADLLPNLYAVGVLVMSVDSRFRRLGDLVAGTLVISEERGRLRQPLMIHPPPSPRELARIPARPGLTARDVEALELFVSRFDDLAPARQEELAEIIAPDFSRRLGLKYRNPARFLALLYFRVTQGSADASVAPPPAPRMLRDEPPPASLPGQGGSPW